MTTPKSKPAPLPTTPPDLSGRVWAAWAFETEDEARRAAAFLNGAEDERNDHGTEFVINTGTQDAETQGEEHHDQGESWNTGDPGARADVYQDPSTPLVPWRMVWSCEAEPDLSDTLEAAEESAGVECELWLSPFDLPSAMEDAEAGTVNPLDLDGLPTGEAYDFGQPDRARPFQGVTYCAECESDGELNDEGLCCGCSEDAEDFGAETLAEEIEKALTTRKAGQFSSDGVQTGAPDAFLTVERWGRRFTITVTEEA